MKISTTVYTNRKGTPTVMLRLPMPMALALGVGDEKALHAVQLAIQDALNDRRGEGATEVDDAE